MTIQGGYKLIIKESAACYNPDKNQLLSECYHLNGFKISALCQNFAVEVTSGLYVNKINKAEKRRIIRCKSAGFIAGKASEPDVETLYDFLQLCRSEKGYKISLSLIQLQQLFFTFPERMAVFIVRDHDKIVAVSITVRVNQSVLYNFLSGSLSSYRQYSPAAMLTESIYIFCQNEQISLLDLGISLDNDGNEKPGLIRFKKNIGGTMSWKTTYTKVFR